MARVLFYHNLHAFDILNWVSQETAAFSLKILTITLKPHFFEKNRSVATIL